MTTGRTVDLNSVICPRCGELTDVLSDRTGWCSNCTKEQSIYTCERCGSEFQSKTARPYCTYCRELNWLEVHADEIEDVMIKEGCSFRTARTKVSEAHRSRCVACGRILPKVGYFCKKNSRCRKLYTRFHKKRLKGMSVEQALKETLHDAENT